MLKIIVQNSISKVVLLDVVQNVQTGVFVPLHLNRIKLPDDLIRPHEVPEGFESYYLKEAPPRPPSSLPPPGSITLETNLSTFLGSGRTGIVYSLENAILSDPAQFSPELVFKFARLHRCADLHREAWFYEEMECLQGVAIPRCYGLFEAEIPSGCELLLPENQTLVNNPDSRDAQVDQVVHPLITELRSTRNKLCILVEERLGGRLPIGSPFSPEVREDLNTLFAEIGPLGILNENDIRHANILQAPACPPGLPSLVSPFTFRTHGWRMIDFEMAAKTQDTPATLNHGHQEYLQLTLYNLERGYVCDLGGSD
ncbi:hypothetical protein C8J55DRAFT_503363 [Lentinula edodes]|uniref:Protein kinase domain-containing protein n=1 Tax=Lentinula lateritia TaxID=40482 RepID=A0A9W9AX05_9AGAR|nr:hypothetical protein C8J55DRAFT_503363 [Lentinula edodes]